MGRLCGGAHEILGIKAPLFPYSGWLEGSWGGVGGGGMGHRVGGWLVMGWLGLEVVGGCCGGVVGPMTPPIMGVSDAPHGFS